MKVFGVIVVLLGAAAAEKEPQPQPREESLGFNYFLWTKDNPGDDQHHEIILGDSNSLSTSHFQNTDPTVVLVHGWNSTVFPDWILKAKTELLKHGPHNVILLDWAQLSQEYSYFSAALAVPMLGEEMAFFLEWLKVETGMDVTKLQLVGHSLGAHITGAAGQILYVFTLPRITGLDPSVHEFSDKPPEARLDPSDAEFVQVIHTNGCLEAMGCVGFWEVLGHADFYPNGGRHQPSCELSSLCSHWRSVELWNESINGDPGFSSQNCTFEDMANNFCITCHGPDCVQMGYNLETGVNGVFYLTTNPAPPYAMG